MPRLTLTAGIDGSGESLDAADWAAREAERRGLPLRLLYADPAPDAPADELLGRAARELSYAHPALSLRTEHVARPAVPALLAAAAESEALVLGTRGFTAFAGFPVGSVALAVAACAERPVVLVRAGELPQDERLPAGDGESAARVPYRPVVLGLDVDRPGDDLLGYAFDAASVRRAPLHVLHAWTLPPLHGLDRGAAVLPPDPGAAQRAKEQTLTATLRTWRAKFPDTPVEERVLYGSPGHQLIKAATGASLLAVGRHSPAGLGRTAHSAVHHVTCPVVVVPVG